MNDTIREHKWVVPAGLVLIVIATLAAYIPAMRAGFIWDDNAYVWNNRTLRSIDGLRQIWSEIGATPQYYPMVHTSYWLEYRLWGSDPTGYHVVNIFLHIFSAVLLWRVLTTLEVPGALLAAAIFALHPVDVESVAWITERKNVLSGVFYLGAALAYLRYALAPKEPGKSRRFYIVSLMLFVCALLSKTVTCSLPAALLLVLWWKRKGLGWSDVFDLVPFFILGVVVGLLTVWMEKHRVGAVGQEWNLSFVERCLIAGRAICFYAGKLFWPGRLTFIYPRWHIDAAVWQQYLYPAAAVVVIAAFWLVRSRAGKGPLVAILFFVGTLAPALGFFDVYPMRFSFVADHFQYLACIGIIVLVSAAINRAAARFDRRVKNIATVLAVFIPAVLGVLTWQQCRVYRSAEMLWRDTLEKNPDSWMAHTNLGIELTPQGKFDEAVSHYLRALQLKPDHAEAHNNLGSVLARQGKSDEAVRCYRRALEIEPGYTEAHYNLGIELGLQGRFDEAAGHFRLVIQVQPDNADAHYNLGNVLKSQGALDEAISQYRQTLKIRPDDADAHNNLGSTLAAQGKLDEAISQFRQTLLIRPDDAEANYNLGLAFKLQGNPDEALKYFRQAIRNRPDYPAALNAAARILITHPDPNKRGINQTIVFAERAAELTGRRNATVLETLAAGYAAAGRSDEAAAVVEEAIALAVGAKDDEMANQLRRQLELYRKAEP